MAGESAFSFRESVKTYRRTLTEKERRKKVKRQIWLYPLATERQYYREIGKVLNPFFGKTQEFLDNQLQEIIRQKEILDVRSDGWIEDIEKFLNELGFELDQEEIENILTGIAAAAFVFNKKQFQKTVEPVVGFNFVASEPWWEEMEKVWRNRNYGLIKGLKDEYIKKINDTVWTGFTDGLSNREIAKRIEEIKKQTFGRRYKIDPKTGRRRKVQSRAELIARDQVGKLNGELTKRRMQDIGVDIYEWLTAFDERVRGRPGGRYPKAIPSHWEMQGKLCKWSDDFVYAEKGEMVWKTRTGKMPKAPPGSEKQCRCTASTFWDDFLSEIDNNL